MRNLKVTIVATLAILSDSLLLITVDCSGVQQARVMLIEYGVFVEFEFFILFSFRPVTVVHQGMIGAVTMIASAIQVDHLVVLFPLHTKLAISNQQS